jgi:hypothetical protein
LSASVVQQYASMVRTGLVGVARHHQSPEEAQDPIPLAVEDGYGQDDPLSSELEHRREVGADAFSSHGPLLLRLHVVEGGPELVPGATRPAVAVGHR